MTEQTIELIDTRPNEVREYMDTIKVEIAKAFTVPAWAMRPATYQRWYVDTYRATEVVRNELVKLAMAYPPAMLVRADGEQLRDEK